MLRLGWKSVDIVIVTGDAYVDHPSFGAALIGRWLEAHGYKVAIIAQPLNAEEIARLGKPNLFFGVTSGNVDSMVANYTASRRKRRSDDYTPGGINNRRPDRALIQYVNMIRRMFKDVPIVIGGLEASLRRFSHYDWWSDKVRKSVLLDSKADILVYGMGERAVLEIAKRLESGAGLDGVRGTVVWKNSVEIAEEFRNCEVVTLPSHEEVVSDRRAYAKMHALITSKTDPIREVVLTQRQDSRYVLQYPPAPPLSTEELDALYTLPFTRAVHPLCGSMGRVKAIETVRFSITVVRGCYGQCSFCALTQHQTTHVISRSEDSIIEEAKLISNLPDFRGTIVDVGGPTANLWGARCEVRDGRGQCSRLCLLPNPCRNAISDGGAAFLELLRKLRALPKVKHVFVSSGIRHDLILASKNSQEVIEGLVEFTPGQLKLAPEHSHPDVLKFMRKPPAELFLEFKARFEDAARRKGVRKYVVGYFIVGHPGEGEAENMHLVRFIKKYLGYVPQQVQIFTPTPGTLSTTMFYTGIDPFTGESVRSVRDERTRRLFKDRIIPPSERGGWLAHRSVCCAAGSADRFARQRCSDEFLDSFE